MIDNADDLRDKANEFKTGLKKRFINIPIGDEEYGFRISGIGQKSVKLEKYVKFDEIFEAIESGKYDHIHLNYPNGDKGEFYTA